MKKIILSFFCCFLVSIVLAFDFQSGDLCYNITSRVEPFEVEVTNGNYSFDSVSIPETVYYNGVTYTVTSIADLAFQNCYGLTSIEIPNSITEIKDYSLTNLYKLKFNIYENCKYLGNEENPYLVLVKTCSTDIAVLNINSNCKIILDYAFSKCNLLTSVELPNEITQIGRYAFSGCSNLTSIAIYDSIKYIGDKAFEGCELLDYNVSDNGFYLGNSSNPYVVFVGMINKTNYFFNINNACKVLLDYSFSQCKQLTSLDIPNSVVYIGSNAFEYCENLCFINLSSNITSICTRTFYDCWNLRSINIPQGVRYIENDAFNICGTITNIEIPNSVIYIGYRAFGWCSNLQSVIFPEFITNIPDDIFYSSDKVYYVVCLAKTPPTLTKNAFTSTDNIYVPYESVDSYKSAPVWKYKTILSLADITVTSSNEKLGTVKGSGTYIPGTHNMVNGTSDSGSCFSEVPGIIYISASPAEGCHFEKWNDGNKDNPRQITPTIDSTFTAIFGEHIIAINKAVSSTCTTTGLTEGKYCSVCGAILVKQDTIKALGHNEVTDEAVVVSCTSTGLTEGKHCSVCGEVLVAQQTIPVIDHKFTNYIYNNDATTEADGTETAICDYGCGVSFTRTAEGTKLTDIADESANGVVVYAHHNVIVVENATADIYVYDAMGRLVARRGVSEGSAQIAMPHEGIYIVKCGVEVKRVSVSRN